jgi:hypothetical protein
MPPDRLRTTNSQGRQKSCSECAKAKRRCGLEHPNCARCSRQHLTCVYPLQPRTQGTNCQEDSWGISGDFDITDATMDLPATETSNLSFDFDIPAMSSSSCTDVVDFDFSAGVTSLDSIAAMLNNSSPEEDHMALQRAVHCNAESFSPAHLSQFAKSRIDYSIEQLKFVPKMMVEQNGTPWAHCMLYEDQMPRSLQDAHAACALYIAKNDTNAEHVARFITSRAKNLTISELPSTPSDVLARAQALLLYQIMLVFGDGILPYGGAEGLLPHLEAIGSPLFDIAAQQTDTTAVLKLYPATAARSAWRAYVFGESVRRTLLVLYHITAICNLLRGQLQSCAHTLAFGNRITLSAHLWNAKSAFDFAVAWNNGRHFLVKDLDFTEVMRDAKPDDLDLFSKMTLVGLQGIDDIRGWFYTRGGVL